VTSKKEFTIRVRQDSQLVHPSDEPRSPMSKGDARVSGTAPTYYTVDALDECPNTPGIPCPVT
jgi:hypothetical protein